MSVGDFDGDGDVDLFVADAQGSRLYRNRTQGGNWLGLALRGNGLNTRGLGARIEVVAGGQRQYREVQCGIGYASQVAARTHFGLGTADRVDSVRVVWPDGMETVETDLAAGTSLLLVQPVRTAVAEESEEIPGIFRLSPNYPNPFNAHTVIPYQLPEPAPVRLHVYNIAGQKVKVLVDQKRDAGVFLASWDGTDESGQQVGNGVYFVRLATDTRSQTRRLLLLK